MYYYNLYQHRRARRNKERSCKSISSGQSGLSPIHWLCFIFIFAAITVLSLFRLYSYYLSSNTTSNKLHQIPTHKLMEHDPTIHSAQSPNIVSDSQSNVFGNRISNEYLFNAMLDKSHLPSFDHNNNNNNMGNDQSIKDDISNKMNELHKSIDNTNNNNNDNDDGFSAIVGNTNTNPNPINILDSNVIRSAPLSHGHFGHVSHGPSLHNRLILSQNDENSVNNVKLDSKQELMYGLAKGLKFFTSYNNDNDNDKDNDNENDNSSNEKERIEVSESSNNKKEDIKDIILNWECETSKEEMYNELKSKYLKLFFMIGLEGSGHHLWKHLFTMWTDAQKNKIKSMENERNLENKKIYNGSRIYFESYDDESKLTTCLHTCFAWDDWQVDNLDQPWMLDKLHFILNSMNFTNIHGNNEINDNINNNTNNNNNNNNDNNGNARNLLSSKRQKIELANQRAKQLQSRRQRYNNENNNNNNNNNEKYNTIHNSRIHRSQTKSNKYIDSNKWDILYKDVQWQQPGCQCVKYELLCNYAMSLKNNSLLIPRFYSYPYFAHSITRVPNIVQLLQYSQLKSENFMYQPKIIVMYREYIEIIVSNCIHRQLHRINTNLANKQSSQPQKQREKQNENENDNNGNNGKRVSVDYVKQCISFYPTILTLIQSQLLAIDPMYWIMFDYKDFVTRSVEYSDIISKFLEIDKDIIEYGLKFAIKASKTTENDSAWNELMDISPELAFIVKRTFYQQQASQWPIFNKKFIVTPENTWFLDVKYHM